MHNLKNIDLQIPRHRFVVVCGVSGSGKTSLALDTLYAEGQRRYIESFSPYTRQFLQRLDKPDFDALEGLPPAIAVARGGASRGNRSTVATATETADYLRLLFAQVSHLECYRCGLPVRAFDPQSTADALAAFPPHLRAMIGFPVTFPNRREAAEILADLQNQGFVRLILGPSTYNLSDDDRRSLATAISPKKTTEAVVVVDRVTCGDSSGRVAESLETAFHWGDGNIILMIEPAAQQDAAQSTLPLVPPIAQERSIDDQAWLELPLGRSRCCQACGIDYPDPQASLFSFNQPLGACPECEGFGDVMEIDLDLIVPDPSKSILQGAIAPWNTPSYRHELEELLAIAKKRKIPTDIPFSQLDAASLQIIREGSAEDSFGGLRGFFAYLERKKYKMHVRVFLSRWRSYRRCPTCQGKRFRDEALAYRIGTLHIAQIMDLQIDRAAEFFNQLPLSPREAVIARDPLDQIRRRLKYLQTVGLGYLQLSRTLRTLSGGENQRVSLTGALGSSLVNMLYVLDEPTVGLHPNDVDRLTTAVLELRDRGNTVVAVEHEESMMRAADHLVEMGPGAGAIGGKVVFEGSLDEMLDGSKSLTAQFLTGQRGQSITGGTRRPPRGFIQLQGARGNNLRGIDVRFPLGLLCLVTGVSGSGKSSLVMQTLFGALARRKRKPAVPTLPYDDCIGDGQIEDVLLIDQSPISRSPRSNPVTYIKAFDPIRNVFAETIDAKTRGMSAGCFSFNNVEGACQTCQGDGVLSIDMQFLADVTIQCPDCKGTRYRPEILNVRYRDASIADCLNLTVRQAMSFFRGHPKVLQQLQRLIDVGLDYVTLGQSATTLSSGEAQRLKLATFLASARRSRTLFILDEPTTGLHFSDIITLVDCFDALIAQGHSLLIVEHNVQLMQAADYLIDLGPGAAEQGGTVVAAGTPEEIMKVSASQTGQVLARLAEKKSPA